MSQSSNNKGKDNGKKYASFNLNSKFNKGAKFEGKTSLGQNSRHGGLQSLGKVKRVLQPTNLPSLKSENSGNDPRVNLVPSGNSGWFNKKENASSKQTTSPSLGGGGSVPKASSKPPGGQDISLRPNAGVDPSKIQKAPEKAGQEKQSWVAKVQPPSQVPSSSPYFQREFPKLGGVDGQGEISEKDQSGENASDSNQQGMGHPMMMAPYGLPPNFHQQFSGERPVFNGQQYPYPPYGMYSAGGGNVPMPFPYPFQFPGGKMPMDPRFMARMGKPPTSAAAAQSSERPGVLKDKDLKAFDDDKENSSWAGAQEEVDYEEKLKFDESDESEDETIPKSKDQKKDEEAPNARPGEKTDNKQKNDSQDVWSSYPQGFNPQQMQMHYGQQGWPRMPPMVFDPQRHPHPGAFPIQHMYIFPPYGFPPNMAQHGPNDKKEDKENDSVADPKKDAAAQRKAEKQERLRDLSEQIKRRDEDPRTDGSKKKHDDISRRRNDSEASDSSRRSAGSKDIPPRFQKQKTGSHDYTSSNKEADKENNSEGQVKIMKRKESLLSEDGNDSKQMARTDGGVGDRRFSDASSSSSQRGSRQSLSETKRSEPSESSTTNQSSKQKSGEKQEIKPYPKTGLKDYSAYKDNDKKKDNNSNRKLKSFPDHKNSSESTARLTEMKLSRNNQNQTKSKAEVSNDNVNAAPSSANVKASPWAKVTNTPTETDEKTKKSLKDIQQEEEEAERKKREQKELLRKSEADFNPEDDEGRQSKEREDSVAYTNEDDKRQRRNDNNTRTPSNRNDKTSRPERRGRFDNESRRGNRYDGDNRYRSGKDDRRERYYRDEEDNNEKGSRNNRSGFRDKNERYPQEDGRRPRNDRKDDYNKRSDSRQDDNRREKVDEHRKRDEYPSRNRNERQGNDSRNDRYSNRNDRYAERHDRHGDRSDGFTERNDGYINKNDRYEKNSRYKDRNDKYDDRYNNRYNSRDHPRDSTRRNERRNEQQQEKKPENERKLHQDKKEVTQADETKASDVEEKNITPPTASKNLEKQESVTPADRVETTVSAKKDEIDGSDVSETSVKRDTYRREDKRGNRHSRSYDERFDDKGDVRRGGERRDERRSDSRRDDRRRDDKRDRFDNRKFSERTKNADGGAPRRNRDWDNRDYRQSEEYHQDIRQQKPKIGPDNKEKETEGNLTKEEEQPSEEKIKPVQKDKEKKDAYFDRSTSNEYFESNSRGRFKRDGNNRGRGGRQGSSRYDDRPRRQQQPYSAYEKHEGREDRNQGAEETAVEPSTDSQDQSTEKMNNEKRKAFAKSCERDTPPRFKMQQERGGGSSRGRDRGSYYERTSSSGAERGRREPSERGRGSMRGRGRGKTRGGFSSPGDYHKISKEITDDFANDEVAYMSENHSSYADDSLKNSGRRSNSKPFKGSNFPNGDNSKQGHFLAKRQQAGSKRTTSSSKTFDKSLPAADKDGTVKNYEVVSQERKYDGNQQASKSGSTIDETSAHSPPKKMKPVGEKKEKRRDISQVYDLNNIRGIVIADHIATGADDVAMNKDNEDEGFTTVTSRRQQKEMREKQREEEKREQERKLQEQKREASKAQKALIKEAKKPEQTTNKAKRMPFTDAPVSSVEVEQVTRSAPGPTTTATVTAPASNAAMAAIGAWEPSQLLMRNQVTTSEQMKSSPLTANVNAWQRPLSLTPMTSLPDPRAVGTGKPSSSHNLSKSSLATPESASPIVTPTVPTPISSGMSKGVLGSSAMIDKDNEQAKKSNTTAVSKSSQIVSEQKYDLKESSERSNKRNETSKDGKKSSNKDNDNRPNRFTSRRDNNSMDQKMNEEKRSSNKSSSRNARDNNDNRGSRKDRNERSDRNERNKKDRMKTYGNENRSSTVSNNNSSKSKDSRSHVDIQNDNVFTRNDATDAVVENITQYSSAPRKSILSDADKVVGSKKPSLKSQSSVGSYTSVGDIASIVDEPVVMVNAKEEFEALPLEEKVVPAEDQAAKHTSRSVIKSLNEDERSLETRSLPGTPPLAVKIPEPSLSGPSSDPGRAPSPTVSKSLTPSIAQEMNEMNIKLFNARKVWDDNPSISWSNQVSSGNSSLSSNPVPVVSVKDSQTSDDMKVVSAVAAESVSITKANETSQKPDEKSVGNFTTKRSEQQVCKVKPQQQVLPSDAVSKTYDTSNSLSHRNVSKYTSLVPNHDSRQQYPLQRPLYPNEPLYSEPLRSQSAAQQFPGFHSLTQMRSLDNSVSPLSHQRDFLLSHPTTNMYGNSQIPSSQSLVALQVVSTPSVQPNKNPPFQSANQTSLFAASAAMTNSPLLFHYNNTTFPPQRNASNLHNVGVLQMQQQQSAPGNARFINMSNGTNQHLRRDQHYQGMPSSSDSLMATSAHMALLLDPNSNAGSLTSGQLGSQPPSGMMKHVHAKPFEPTSQTPPLMQSPPIIAQQNVGQLAGSSRPIPPTVFCQPGSVNAQHGLQNVGRYSQPLLQHSSQARQATIQPMQQQNPMVAQVRPRSVQGHALNSTNSASMSLADTLASYEAGIALMAKNQLKSAAQMNLHQMQLFNNPYAQSAAQLQRNALTQAMNSSLPNRPGPIQRPSQTHQNTNVSAKQPPPFSASTGSMNTSGADGEFRKSQRQKMLEDTKKYFQQQQQGELNAANDVEKQKKQGNNTSNIATSEQDAYILPSSTLKDDAKKFDMKKNQRSNSASDNYRNRNTYTRRQPPNVTEAGNKSLKHMTTPQAGVNTPQQQNKHNIVS